MSAFFYLQPTLNRFFNISIKLSWCWISSSWNMKEGSNWPAPRKICMQELLSKHWKQASTYWSVQQIIGSQFFPEIIKIAITLTNTFQVAEQNDQLFLTCTHGEADTRVDKFGWSVERESGAVTLVWFKGIFFQSLRFNHLTLFLISHILKQTRSFFFQVCLRMYNFLLPTHFNELSFFSTDLLQP